jgi:TPR repeat protein
MMSYNGTGGETQDFMKAAQLYQMAAEQGHGLAQFYLGKMFLDGIGVSPDRDVGIMWIKKAVEQDVGEAQSLLGLFYWTGTVVPLDKIKAYNLLMKASKQGDEVSQKSLDILCKESPWACK